jgi:hypothetical protein
LDLLPWLLRYLVRRREVEGDAEGESRFLADATGPKVVRPLWVEDGGFSLHAATRAGAEDEAGRANLFNYVLRPPNAQEHVTLTADGLVAIQLKKPFRDGTVSVVGEWERPPGLPAGSG